MHVLIVTDQHPDSLGGAQVAIRAQRAALERGGLTVTIAAPARAQGDDGHDPGVISLPSRPITRDREYTLSWPGARTDRRLATALRGRPPVDLVHLEGDFWGALIGLRAARGLRVPVVHTLHNNVDEGTRAVTPLAPAVFWALRWWRRLTLGRPRGAVAERARGAWRYLAELAAEAAVVTAPSRHFADTLERRGVAERVEVTRGGIDDAAVAALRGEPRAERPRPHLVWLGRMSAEKRVLELLDAFALARVDADLTLYGAGLLLPQVEARIVTLNLSDRVHLAGPVPHAAALRAIHQADALLQTSIGFETQGLTPFEAALLGTPTVFCDPAIAADAAVTPSWLAADARTASLADALRAAVSDLAARPGEVRVPWDAARDFLQSVQTEHLLRQYARALTAGR